MYIIFFCIHNFYMWFDGCVVSDAMRNRFQMNSIMQIESYFDSNQATLKMMCKEIYLSVGSFGSIRWNFRRLPPRFLRRSSGFVGADVDCVLGNVSMALFFLLFINDSGIWHWTIERDARQQGWDGDGEMGRKKEKKERKKRATGKQENR